MATSSESRAFKRPNFLINDGEGLGQERTGHVLYSSADNFHPSLTFQAGHTTLNKGLLPTAHFLFAPEHIPQGGRANIAFLMEGLTGRSSSNVSR
jgi:hypothetical protein